MNDRGTRGWLDALRRRHDAPPAGGPADPAWMTGVSAETAAQSAEGRDEGWIVSSWELRRGLQVREGASPETLSALAAMWSEVSSAGGCDIELPLGAMQDAQAVRSSSRRSAAPSSITASA